MLSDYHAFNESLRGKKRRWYQWQQHKTTNERRQRRWWWSRKKEPQSKKKTENEKKHNGKKHWKRVCEVFGMILLIKWPCSSSLSPFLFLSVPYGMNSVSFLAWHLHDFLLPFTPYSLMWVLCAACGRFETKKTGKKSSKEKNLKKKKNEKRL